MARLHAALEVEREFPDGLHIPMSADGAAVCRKVVDGNATHGVTWVHSYVSLDKKKTYCVYDGPSPDAVRRAAETNQLPISSVSEVRVLDPYFYA